MVFSGVVNCFARPTKTTMLRRLQVMLRVTWSWFWLIKGASHCLSYSLTCLKWSSVCLPFLVWIKLFFKFFDCPCPFIVWNTGWKFQIHWYLALFSYLERGLACKTGWPCTVSSISYWTSKRIDYIINQKNDESFAFKFQARITDLNSTIQFSNFGIQWMSVCLKRKPQTETQSRSKKLPSRPTPRRFYGPVYF